MIYVYGFLFIRVSSKEKTVFMRPMEIIRVVVLAVLVHRLAGSSSKEKTVFMRPTEILRVVLVLAVLVHRLAGSFFDDYQKTRRTLSADDMALVVVLQHVVPIRTRSDVHLWARLMSN
jgi:hypothetical protein